MPRAARSRHASSRCRTDATIADGLRSSLAPRTFAAIRADVDCDRHGIAKTAIVRAMRMTWERMKIVIEPSAAVPLACLLEGTLAVAGQRVGVIVSAAATSTSTGCPGRRRRETRRPRLSGDAPLLDVRGVTLQYKTKDHLVTATYRVDFEVFRSDRFVLLGPSGCGKSTLLKAVGGYMTPSRARSG